MLEKCVLTVLELNWNKRLGHKKTKLNICHHMLTSSTQLQNRSFHVVERTRTSSKCQKMKYARAKRAKVLFSIVKYVYIIDQARGQDGWILAEYSFCVFMDRDEVEVHKNVKRERGQYSAILTELAWSIKDLLYGIKSTEKNDLRTCLFSSTEKEPSEMLK